MSNGEPAVEVEYGQINVVLQIPCRYCGGAQEVINVVDYNPTNMYGLRLHDPYGGTILEICGGCLRGLLDLAAEIEKEREAGVGNGAEENPVGDSERKE
jgi:hypothetical protein